MPTHFLPAPPNWKLALQHDFTQMKSFPSDDWHYGGRPGGTSNCLWETANCTMDAEGLLFKTFWDATEDSWLSAGVGTNESWEPPVRVRVYQRDHDWAINGLNNINLLWTGPWFYEVDGYECGVDQGRMATSIARCHNNNGDNVINPVVSRYYPDVKAHCDEFMLFQKTLTVFRDGLKMPQTSTFSDADWAAICSKAKWLGIQTELYSKGLAPITAISRRSIHGVEVFVPA